MTSDPAAVARPVTVSLGDEEAVKRLAIETLFGLWATVNNLSRRRPSKRERYRVTVFGSARPRRGTGCIPTCVNGADEALAIIRAHHQRWKAAQAGQA